MAVCLKLGTLPVPAAAPPTDFVDVYSGSMGLKNGEAFNAAISSSLR